MTPSCDILPSASARVRPGAAPRCTGHQLQVCGSMHPRRAELERFIREVFASRHGASIRAFMPTLLALRGEGGRSCGVAGLGDDLDDDLDDDWGRYCSTDPRVMAAHLPASLELRRRRRRIL